MHGHANTNGQAHISPNGNMYAHGHGHAATGTTAKRSFSASGVRRPSTAVLFQFQQHGKTGAVKNAIQFQQTHWLAQQARGSGGAHTGTHGHASSSGSRGGAHGHGHTSGNYGHRPSTSGHDGHGHGHNGTLASARGHGGIYGHSHGGHAHGVNLKATFDGGVNGQAQGHPHDNYRNMEAMQYEHATGQRMPSSGHGHRVHSGNVHSGNEKNLRHKDIISLLIRRPNSAHGLRKPRVRPVTAEGHSPLKGSGHSSGSGTHRGGSPEKRHGLQSHGFAGAEVAAAQARASEKEGLLQSQKDERSRRSSAAQAPVQLRPSTSEGSSATAHRHRSATGRAERESSDRVASGGHAAQYLDIATGDRRDDGRGSSADGRGAHTRMSSKDRHVNQLNPSGETTDHFPPVNQLNPSGSHHNSLERQGQNTNTNAEGKKLDRASLIAMGAAALSRAKAAEAGIGSGAASGSASSSSGSSANPASSGDVHVQKNGNGGGSHKGAGATLEDALKRKGAAEAYRPTTAPVVGGDNVVNGMKVGTLGVEKDELKLHDSWHEGNDDGGLVPAGAAGQGLPGTERQRGDDGTGRTTNVSTSIQDYIIGKQVG